jgi:Domain of unknown function (DUF5925)/ATPase family associated with various cellular activities (AAA)
MTRRLHFTFDLAENVSAGLFFEEALKRDLNRFRSESWPTTSKLEHDGALFWSTEPQGVSAVLDLSSGGLGHVQLGFGSVYAQVAASSDEATRLGLEEIRALLPRAERDQEGRVPVRFWSYGQHGPMAMSRSLAVPTWEEIVGNYPDQTGKPLARLMTGDLPWRGGQLILWHGETGTGKTTALRALAREWAEWCEPHYITDPEKFFGDQSDYMLAVMLESEMFMDDEDGDEVEGELMMHGGMWVAAPHVMTMMRGGRADQGRSQPRWRLLILEDTGELLSADARLHAGQGLSRFLNVVDGLIGQGLRILVLVTTNEPLGRLHPAVARPGRCAANVLFERITSEQANAWLSERGHDARVSEPVTLAALYALVEGWDVVTERQTTGFGQS